MVKERVREGHRKAKGRESEKTKRETEGNRDRGIKGRRKHRKRIYKKNRGKQGLESERKGIR